VPKSPARKATPNPRKNNPNPNPRKNNPNPNPNPKKKTPNRGDQAALKRVVASVLDDAQAAIDDLVETLVQEAMLYASGEDDDPDYRAYAEAALVIACESAIIPKRLARTGKEVLTPDYVRSVLAGFC
jgi:hypothetical protein